MTDIHLVSAIDMEMVSMSNAIAAGILLLAGCESENAEESRAVGGLLTLLQVATKEKFAENKVANLFREHYYTVKNVHVNQLDKFFCSTSAGIKNFCGKKELGGFLSLDHVSTSVLDMEWLKILSFTDMIAYVGVVTLLTGRNLPRDGFQKWMKSKLEYFRTALKAPNGVPNCLYSILPSYDVSVILNNFFSNLFVFRRYILEKIFMLSSREGAWAVWAQAVLKQFKGAGMHHFSLINEYIVFRHPYLLAWEPIKTYFPVLYKTYTCLEEAESVAALRPYYTLTHSSEQSWFLDGKNHRVLIAIALVIRKCYGLTDLNCIGSLIIPKFIQQLALRSVAIIKGKGVLPEDKNVKKQKILIGNEEKLSLISLIGNFRDFEDDDVALTDIQGILSSYSDVT